MKNCIQCFVKIIFILYSIHSFGGESDRSRKIDSLLNVANSKNITKNKKIEIYLKVAAYNSAISPKLLLFYNNKALTLLKNVPKGKLIGRYYANMALYYNITGKYTESEYFYKKAIIINRYDEEREWYFLTAINLASTQFRLKKYGEMEILLLNTIKDAKNEKALNHLGLCYLTMSYLLDRTFREKESYDFKIKAYNLFTLTKKEQSRSGILMSLGYDYLDDKDYLSAIEKFKEAFEIQKKLQNQYEMIFLLRYITKAYIGTKDYQAALKLTDQATNMAKNKNNKSWDYEINKSYGEIYFAQKKFDLAENYFKKSLVYVQFANVPVNDEIYTNFILSKLSLAKKNVKNAELYYLKTKKLYLNQKSDDALINLKINTLTLKSSIDSTNNDYKSALIHYKSAIFLKDSLQNIKNDMIIQSVKTRFQVAEKDDNIKVLSLKNKVQKAEIKTQNQKTLFFIILCIIALILVSLLAYIVKTKQKTNLQLDAKNNQLTGLLNDKELLLKEIHHRTKNNLQLLMSILKSQTRQIDKDTLTNFIQESQSRIVSMSLIHEALYNHDTSEISFEKYVHDLYTKINEVYNVNNQKTELNINFNNINLDVQTSIILGLMLNELICNSFKYAFADNETGIININLNQENKNKFSLNYSDNGTNSAVKSSKTFGKQLIQSLAEQLSGNLIINDEKGIVVQMLFSDLKNLEVKYA